MDARGGVLKFPGAALAVGSVFEHVCRVLSHRLPPRTSSIAPTANGSTTDLSGVAVSLGRVLEYDVLS